jgi:hypothetical protein
VPQTMRDGTLEDPVMAALTASYSLPGGGSEVVESDWRKTLLDDGPWDAVDLGALLPLKETVFINTEVGYRLRHYWVPATSLTYHSSTLISQPGNPPLRLESEIHRDLAKCRADSIIWREKVKSVAIAGEVVVPIVLPEALAPGGDELLFYYHRGYQALRVRPLLSRQKPAPTDLVEAQRRAIALLPILFPFEPLAIGESWNAKAGEDTMTYRLVAEGRVGTTSVVLIRREGTTSHTLPMRTPDGFRTLDLTIERKGLTVFAYHRSVVLEDRMLERTVAASCDTESHVGSETRGVLRLIRSAQRRPGS